MKITTDFFLKVLQILSWFIFVGISIDAGGFLSNAIYAVFINSTIAERFWNNLNLSPLYEFNKSHFVTVTVLMVIVTTLKAVMFYLIVKIFYDKKLNLSQPFNETVGRFILNMACLAFGIGLFSSWGAKVIQGLVSQKVIMPALENMRIGGADVWIFTGVILLVIAQIFKKGIEIQKENELTI